MTPHELRARTSRFAVDITRFTKPLLPAPATAHAASQLIRAATAVAANYRAAGRGRSHAEFTAKIGLVLEEADECLYWLEYLKATDAAKTPAFDDLLQEAAELVAIFAKAADTARRHGRGHPPRVADR